MQTLHEIIRHRFYLPKAVFRIPTARGVAYLSVARSNFYNEERGVVEVDAERFLSLWRTTDTCHREISSGNPSTWPTDYKFHDAEAGFSKGEDNPVPLAQVAYNNWMERRPIWRRRFVLFKEMVGVEEYKREELAFLNGITRTIWLLTFGAKAFPVECNMDSAHRLHELAGMPGGQVITVAQLLPTINVFNPFGAQPNGQPA